MKKFACIAAVVGLALILSSSLWAQTQDVYQVTYFDNRAQNFDLDSTLRIINPGLQGSPISADQGTLCANLFVFDDTQEMVECCSCPITANGLLTISVDDITDVPLTVTPNRGVIKLISSHPNPTCDPTNFVPTPNLRAFAMHLQLPIHDITVTKAAYAVTEDEFADSPLSAVEQHDLATICSFVRYLGTGRGRCDNVCTGEN